MKSSRAVLVVRSDRMTNRFTNVTIIKRLLLRRLRLLNEPVRTGRPIQHRLRVRYTLNKCLSPSTVRNRTPHVRRRQNLANPNHARRPLRHYEFDRNHGLGHRRAKDRHRKMLSLRATGMMERNPIMFTERLQRVREATLLIRRSLSANHLMLQVRYMRRVFR